MFFILFIYIPLIFISDLKDNGDSGEDTVVKTPTTTMTTPTPLPAA